MGLLKIVSWDGHVFNATDYTAVLITNTGLPSLEPLYAERYQATAVITGVKFTQYQLSPLQIVIENKANEDALRLNLHRWFDSKDAKPKRLVVEDVGGGNSRYIEGVCLSLMQVASQGALGYSVIIALDGDYDPHYRFRSVTTVTENWAVTGSGQTKAITNSGHDEAYPIIRITPTSAKSSGDYTIKRWIPIVWRSPKGATRYPVDITGGGLNTTALIAAGKVRPTGDDFRIEVNGAEVPRYYKGAFSSATKKIWVNLSFTGVRRTTLKGSMTSGAITEIPCNSSISGFPQSGTLLINNEAFLYAGKADELQTFLGVTRAVNNTTAVTHTSGADIYLVENDVWLKYGNSSAPSYVVDDYFSPVIQMNESTNGSWKFYNFRGQGKERAASWSESLAGGILTYSSPYFSGNPDYPVYGLLRNTFDYAGTGRVFTMNPCGITRFKVDVGTTYHAPWGSGSSAYLANTRFVGAVDGYGGRIQETAVENTLPTTWQTWSRDLTSLTNVYEVYIEIRPNDEGNSTGQVSVEISEATLTLNAVQTPLLTLGAEFPNYTLAATLTNLASGDVFSVNFSMEPDETLEINTDTKEVVYLKDGSNQYNVISRPKTAGPIWMRLLPVVQTFNFTDVGTTGVTIEFNYQKRFYY